MLSPADDKPEAEPEPKVFKSPKTEAPGDGMVAVSVLGPVRIVVNGVEVKTLRRNKAREMLAYLALRPQGATWEAAGTALWPSATVRRVNQRFRTTLSELRMSLRSELGVDGMFIDAIGEHYVIDPKVFDCDVWRFEEALSDASRSGIDEATEMEALQRVRDEYKGDLADGSHYEWSEAPREDLRRRALDALGRLAELQQSKRNSNFKMFLESIAAFCGSLR